MSELADLERRVTAALDRIGAGLERMGGPAEAPTADSAEVTALTEALEAEKTANAQLEERLKTLRRKEEARIKELEDEVDDLKAASAETTSQLGQAHHDLEAAMRAQAEGAGAKDAEKGAKDAEKQALASELQGLRNVRDADRAELDAVIASLKPLLEDQPNA